MTSIESDVAARIRKGRRKANLTQKEMAEKTGIALRTYQSYERGEVDPPYDKAEAIFDVLPGEEQQEATYAGNRNIAEGAVEEALGGEDLSEVGRHVTYEVIDDETGKVQFRVEVVVSAGATRRSRDRVG